MSETDPHHKQESVERRPRAVWLRPLLAVVGVAAVIGVMFSAFAAPSVHAGPDALPLAVSGSSASVAALEDALARSDAGAFDVTAYASADDAEKAIRDRDAVGGFALDQDRTTVLLASAAGSGYSQALRSIGLGLSAQGQSVAYRDVVPFTADDPAGAGVSALAIPLIFGAMISSVILVLVLRVRGRARAGLALAVAVLAGLVITTLMRFAFHSIDDGFLLTAVAVSMGTAAIGLTVLGLESAIGSPGLGMAAMLMMFVANPLSGFATGWQWLPHPWGLIGQLLPVGATGTAVRSTAFFDGHGATTSFVVLGAWIAVGLALVLGSAARTPQRPDVESADVRAPEGSARMHAVG